MSLPPYQKSNLRLYNCECAVEFYGNPKGETIIALHGWLDNLATFASMIPHFKDFRVVAIDFPGHGYSKHLPEGAMYQFADNLVVLADLYQQLKIEKAILLGHSMGGAIASIFAACFPFKVTKLVLLDALGPLTLENKNFVQHLTSAVEARLKAKSKKRVFDSISQAVKIRSKINNIDQRLIEPMVNRAVKKEGQGFIWRSDAKQMLPSMTRMSEAQVEVILKNIACPTLLICGKESPARKADLVESRVKCLEDLKKLSFSGGHYTHLENTAEICKQISKFLESL